jgi:hypothetical protein
MDPFFQAVFIKNPTLPFARQLQKYAIENGRGNWKVILLQGASIAHTHSKSGNPQGVLLLCNVRPHKDSEGESCIQKVSLPGREAHPE